MEVSECVPCRQAAQKKSGNCKCPVRVSVAATYAQLGCFFLPLASPCRPRFCAMGNDLRPRSLASELVLLTQAVKVFCVHKLLLLVYKSQSSLSNHLKKSRLNRDLLVRTTLKLQTESVQNQESSQQLNNRVWTTSESRLSHIATSPYTIFIQKEIYSAISGLSTRR